MPINKLKIEKEKSDINLKFYIVLKYLVKSKITDNQALAVLEICQTINKSKDSDVIFLLTNAIQTIPGENRKECLNSILGIVLDKTDIELFAFGLQLFLIK